MLQYNSMGNTWNGIAFIKSGFGKKSSSRNKKNFFPCAGKKLWQDIGSKNSCSTATAAATGMCILGRIIKDQKAAVLMTALDINVFF